MINLLQDEVNRTILTKCSRWR